MEFEMFVAPINNPTSGMYFNGHTNPEAIAEKLVNQGLANSGDELAVQDIDSEGITIESGYNIEAYNRFAS